MKCYYEELGIPRDAKDTDIKTAYRKLALRWHPDKNPDALDEAKERFQLIQQAYEVLSDPQERAWYDNHREQILRGKNSDYTENCLDVFEYFTSSCFRGYGDDAKGFYAVYREVFEKIAAEDAEFMDDEDEVDKIPTFGDSKSSYEEVVGPFYAYWQAYCTKKTYTWLCPYDVKEIRDRRVLREVEKDMKKLVQKARKERNEEVRNLVSFVRKRDRRVQAYRKLLEERAELNRKKQEQNRLEQIRKRQREVEEMRQNQKQSAQHHNDDYEAQLKLLEQNYGGSSADEESESDTDEDQEAEDDKENENAEVASDEDEFYIDDLYCVACNKMFKNDRAYANHESSKKHREALERMKLEMQAEEQAFQGNNEGDDESDELVNSETKDLSDYADEQDSTTDTHNLANEVDVSADEQPVTGKKGKKSKKARKNAKLNKSQQPATDDEHETVTTDLLAQAKIVDSDEEEDWNRGGKKSARKNKNKKQNKKAASEMEKPNTTKDEIKVLPKTEEPNIEIKQKIIATTSDDDGDDSDEFDIKSPPPKAKAKPKANQSSSAASTSTSTAHVCVTCKANFPSKNKLFAHLKITNHGVYIPKAGNDANAAAAESGKGAKKGKGKKK